MRYFDEGSEISLSNTNDTIPCTSAQQLARRKYRYHGIVRYRYTTILLIQLLRSIIVVHPGISRAVIEVTDYPFVRLLTTRTRAAEGRP